jgi:plastocyanin
MFRQVCTTVAIACLFGCGGSGGGTAPVINNTPAPPNGISVENDFFTPTTKTVMNGTAVVWAWNSCTDNGYAGGQTCVAHNIVFDDGSGITSGVMDQGTFTRSFPAPGTYNYHCAIHGAAVMSGSITVQ